MTATGDQIVAAAMQWIGVPYLWGGGRGTVAQARAGGLDCSGLVLQVAEGLGLGNIGGDTGQQINSPNVSPVASLDQAQPGDLVFFNGTVAFPDHVGIYMGNGMMIDAPHTGASVRIDQVSGFGSIVGIRRINGVAGDTGTTTLGASSGIGADFTKTATHLLVELAAVGSALGLIVLGATRATSQGKKAKP